MSPRSAALALALLAGPAAAQRGAEPLTLEAAVEAAVRNSPAALAAEQDISIARQRLREARFLALPQFTLSGTATRLNLEYPSVLGPELGERFLDPALSDTFYTLRAQALQPLYTGGKNTNTMKLARTAHSQAKVDYEAARAAAALGAKRAFYELLYRARLAESEERWLARGRELAAGLAADGFERTEAQALLSELADRAALARGEAETARTALLRAMNREPDYAFEPAGPFEPRPVDWDVSRSLVTAMESRPELQSELYKAQMDDIAVSLAMTRRNPNIYLGASYDLNAYRDPSRGGNSVRSNNWLASLAIHFPLSYDIWTQVQQRRAQQRQGDLKRAGLQDQIRFDIIAAHKEAAARQADASRLAAELERLRAAFEEAARTTRASPAALRAARALADVEARRLAAVYGQLLARVRLEWAQGRDFAR